MAIDENVSLMDVDVCRPEKCPGCDPQEDCVLVAISTVDTTPFLYINDNGGDLDEWDDGIALTGWAADGSAVLCLGDFILAVGNGDGAVQYSDDLGTTLVEHTETEWTTDDGPNDADGVDQSFIVMVHDNGKIWGTWDAARNWEVLDDGLATTEKLTNVMIARDNPQVIYACGASGALVKSENGGTNWYALDDPTGATVALTALYVADQYHVLIGDDDGDIWETSDGGETFTAQDALPNLGASPKITGITGCGCDVLFAICEDVEGSEHTVYRNVDGGASGRWYEPNVGTPTHEPLAIACCDANRAIIVGGDSVDAAMVILLA